MKIESFIPYARQSIDETDILEVSRALQQPLITRGPKVQELENSVAAYCGAQYGVVFNSGTTALMAAYYAANLGPNDKVITTPNTFVATLGSAVQRKSQYVFIDIDLDSGNLDLEQLEYNLQVPSSRGRTVIAPVHFSGIAVDMQKLDSLLKDPDIIIIEDAAHALGSHYINGPKVGSCAWSHMTILSFHPAKLITTGEGGMVLTNDPELADRLRLYRNNGIVKSPEMPPWYHEVTELTGNYNFTDFQAALGLSQLKRLDPFIAKRRALLSRYREKIGAMENIRMFSPQYDAYTAYHLCVVQIDFEAYKTDRTTVMQKLIEKNIGTQLHYIPLYRHPYFVKTAGDLTPYFPNMEKYFAQALSLPLFYDLSLDQVDYIAESLKQVLESS